MDISLPKITELDVLKIFKERGINIPTIIITGYGIMQNAVKAMQLGAFDYLNKPANFEELLEKLEGARKRKAEQEERIRKAEARSLMRKSGELF